MSAALLGSLASGGIGGGGGGTMPSNTATATTGPVGVNPDVNSGMSGHRGMFSNIVTFPGASDNEWSTNRPTGGSLLSPNMILMVVGTIMVIAFVFILRRK